MVLITAVAWGLNWPVLKFVLGEWPPFLFRALSGVGGVLLMLPVALLRGERLWPPRGQFPRLVLAALLNITSWMGLATLALLWLSASEAAILAYTMPIWAALLAWPILGERLGWVKLAGLACGLAGVAVLLAGQLLSAPPAALLAKLPGVIFILGTAWLFALGAVLAKRWPLAMPPAAAVTWQIGLGSLPLAAAATIFERWDTSRVSAAGWVGLAYVSAVALCVAYLAWFRALKLLPASSAATGMLLVPVVGVFSAGFALGEPLGLRQLLALAMTVGGVALASRG
ncbi:MAG: DMT family transporter [Rhodospirillales bacterium]|nr:DMT family transporter [Rhodospirillales bacterium]MDE2574078.1 DMT family transporter [Rhodospirillales bacterium]